MSNTPTTHPETELEKKIKLRIGVIGCGNAGTQIAAAASKADDNYNIFVINSSAKDLHESIVDDNIDSYIIGKSAQGAGRHREVAKAYLKQNGKKLFTDTDSFKKLCINSDVIFVATSTSGGTGSGISPQICKTIQREYPGKIIIFYGIIPRHTDSISSLFNSTECIAEIEQLNIPYILSDLDYYSDDSNDVAYTEVVEKAVEDINIISGKYLEYSKFSMIDEADMKSIIMEPGFMSLYKVDRITQNHLDKQSLQSLIIDTIKRSPAASIMRDGIISQMGIIGSFPQDMIDDTKRSDYTELHKYTGTPKRTTYENYYVAYGSATGHVYLIMSGQTSPMAKIELMSQICDESVRKQKDALLNQKTVSSIRSSETTEFIKSKNSSTIGQFIDDLDNDDSFFD